jgi:hypothetical protein
MLDLIKLVPQIQEMTRLMVAVGPELEQRRAAAERCLRQIAADPAHIINLPRDRSEPRMALPTEEPVDASFPAPHRTGSVTVVAVDGSQIEPDYHEVSACFVINVGGAVFHYEPAPSPGAASLTSQPRLFFHRDDVEPEEESEARFGTWEDLDATRMLAESSRLRDLLEAEKRPGRPLLAFLDGPLIAWRLGWIEPRSRRQEAARNFLMSLDAGRDAAAPVVGYLSRTRSPDVIGLLKFTCCETAVATGQFCARCAAAWRRRDAAPGTPKGAPCFAPVDGLIDTDLFRLLLTRPGERSAVFESNSSVLEQLYDEHRRIGFFFLNAGLEIARVEVPEWVWRDRAMLDTVHAIVYEQIRLGKGYPIAISEAHEQAVVRGPERQAFFELLRRTQGRAGLWADVSAKAHRKRGPIG